MIASRKRLKKNINLTRKNMDKRIYLCSIRKRREKEKVPRVTMKGKPHNKGRRTLVKLSASCAKRLGIMHHSV